MDACMEDRYTPFESSAAFPAESNDSAQAESFCPQLDSPTCSTAQHGHPLEPLGGESAIKLEPGQQSLQIDCRVSQDPYRSSLPQDRPYGTQEGAGQLQDHHQHLGNPAPHSPVEQHQEPQSSYEPARLPEYQHSPVRPVSAEKKCSQCGATKTPMWRNDNQGNKTLCNACGVRLQRQLNKQKQQAQTVQAQPTTLIAGKLPRCRTSPAKLSRQELLASASSRESPERGEAAPAKAGGGSRSLTLVHGQGMQAHLSVAQPPPKRKGSEAAGRNAAAREERKRACNDRSSDSGGGHPSPDAGSPDVVGPITLMAPDKMATNCFAKLHLPASSGQGGAGGMLMVYNEGCNAIAKCSQPGADGQLAYIPEQQAWVWNGHAHCSMVLHNHDTKLRFEELLRKWRMFRQMGFSQALPMQHMSTSLPLDAGLPSFLQGGGNMFPGRHADADDLRFLEHINHKIRGEAAGATPQTGNPKALNALLTEEVFVRLLAAFEYFLQRPQGFTENNVCQLSVNVDWTPNRPVILAVHRYWVGKLQRQGRKEDWQKATRGAGHPASIPRSFSASPPVGSGRSDMSAMTLEDYALSQQRAASEETSDNTQLHSAFATEGSNRPSLDYSTPINYPMPQMVHDSPGMGSFLPGRQPWVLPSCFPPELAPYAMQQVDDWEADPLDPSTLARIADPNQSMGFETRKSGTLTGPSMEDGSMQTPARGMSLQALESVNMGVLPGNPLPEDGQQMFRFLDAPGLLQQSPGNSPRVRHGMRGVGRHSGVDLSSLRKQLYSGSLNELAQDDNMTHQDLTSNQTDHHAFFFDSNDSMKL